MDETSPAAIARALMNGCDRAVLCTSLPADGWPYGSLVAVAPDRDGAPLLYLSDLAEHTRNLAAEPRAALVFAAAEDGSDPLSRPRATALGRIGRSDDEDRLQRYLARHVAAHAYRGFRDFHLYRMEVERVHLVAGFGSIHWLAAHEVLNQA